MQLGTVVEVLSEWLSGLEPAQIGNEAADKATLCLLDFLSAAVAGAVTSEARMLRKSCVLNTTGVATIIGSTHQGTGSKAAFINGCSGHVLDIDDGHRYGMNHPGTSVIPASLALAEEEGVSGEALLSAIVAGYEIAVRFARAMQPSHRQRGHHATGTCGAIGAAAACSNILGLDPVKTANAIAIAATQTPASLLEYLIDGSNMKIIPPGRASEIGLTSARLADAGFNGPRTVFEGKKGFLRAFCDCWNEKALLGGLGKDPPSILGVYFKPYASCRYTHSAIDAALAIREKYCIRPEEIEAIEARVFAVAADGHSEVVPLTSIGATQSIPYSVSIALLRGDVGICRFWGTDLKAPEVLALSAKVRVLLDEDMEAMYPQKRATKLTIKIKDGPEYSHRVEMPHGDPENPMSKEEMIQKFLKCCDYAKWPFRDEIIAEVMRVDDVPNIAELTALLRVDIGESQL